MVRLASLRSALRPTWAFVAATIALSLLVRVPSYLHELFDPDEAAIASQAISLREGGTLYIDAIDRKPPLPPFIYRLSFLATGSNDLRPLHVVAAIGLAGAALVLGLDARRRHGHRAGWWAALLTVGGAVAFFPVDAQSANYAHLALFPGAVAVVWARRGTVTASAGAGLALGVAVLCRQSWIAGIIPGVVAAWWPSPLRTGGSPSADTTLGVEGSDRSRSILRSAVFAATTAASIAAAGLIVPFSDFWSWTFSGTGGYVLSEVAIGPTLGRFGATVGLFVLFHLTLVVAALIAGRDRWLDREGWRDDIDLWLWLGAGCAAVVAGFRFFGHYWLQVLPPAVVLAAPVLVGVSGNLRRWALAGVAVPSGLAVLFALTPATFRDLPDPDPISEYVAAHTLPGEAVLVWGNFPEVHWTSDRLPGGGLVHSDFVTGRSGGRDASAATIDEATPGAVDALMRAARRNPPRLVLDTSVVGLRDYDAYPLRNFPRMYRFVTENYELTTSIDGIDVWTRVAGGRRSDGDVASPPVVRTEGRPGERTGSEPPATDPGAPHSSQDDEPEGSSPVGIDSDGSRGSSNRPDEGATTRSTVVPPAGDPPGTEAPVPGDTRRPPPTGPAAPGTTAGAPEPTVSVTAASVPPAAGFRFEVTSIDAALAARMASSWRPGCPEPLHDLRYLRIGYWDFAGKERLGELVVHADAVGAAERGFRRLHEIRFPIRSMRLVDDFGADDHASMAADNTSAFNCRSVAGTSTWSQHSYGRAIDINPVENPYVTSSGIFPPSGSAHASRTGAPGQFVAGSDAVRAFTEAGWGWGGNWSSGKDYQHFSASGR